MWVGVIVPLVTTVVWITLGSRLLPDGSLGRPVNFLPWPGKVIGWLAVQATVKGHPFYARGTYWLDKHRVNCSCIACYQSRAIPARCPCGYQDECGIHCGAGHETGQCPRHEWNGEFWAVRRYTGE